MTLALLAVGALVALTEWYDARMADRALVLVRGRQISPRWRMP